MEHVFEFNILLRTYRRQSPDRKCRPQERHALLVGFFRKIEEGWRSRINPTVIISQPVPFLKQ
jgi:hypothetical protein